MGVVVEGFRSFSIIMRFREKESVCMSRVSITCSGGDCDRFWEFLTLLECFLRRQKSAARRRRATNARAPRAMPTLAPVEREEDFLEDKFEGAVTADVGAVTVDALFMVEGLAGVVAAAVGSEVIVLMVCIKLMMFGVVNVTTMAVGVASAVGLDETILLAGLGSPCCGNGGTYRPKILL
jgi:hypothetical protein